VIDSTAWPRVGAFSYDFDGPLDALVEAFQVNGLTAVQIGRGLLDEAKADPNRAREIRAAFEEAGIEIVGLGGYRSLVTPDETKRRANIDYLKACFAVTPLLGTSVVATETGSRNPDGEWLPSSENSTPEAWALVEEALGELLPVAEHHGAILAIEGYVNNVIATTQDLAWLLERFPTPSLQVVLDPFNFLSKELLARKEEVTGHFLRQFKSHFVIAHLKDVSPEGAEVDTPEFGAGVFPFEVLFEFLRSERPDLPLILEHLPWNHIPSAVARLHAMTRRPE
jgi:sugar phosphate isomerase/epimerase